ncbi:hypothetical protein V2J09_013218 [Rumex salicifolius]
MVGALIACGASVSAVTDPTAQDPMGKNAASIADANGHKGLAAYLSASALTSRFSDLTIEKEDFRSTSNEFVASDEDQSRMNHVLEVSRKAAERTQTAYRVHSFRRKQQKEAANRGETEYGLTCDETLCVSAAVIPRPKSKNKNVAALTIQKYYKGWKRRTQFLTMRTKVIKIQAHVRGYRFRKYYRVIRVVSIMEKIVLRWRRKRFSLRDFRLKGEAMDEGEERDEDIFKDFRKKKLDTTVNEALERVRCLRDSGEAQGQCSRMLRAFRVAKARLGVSTKALISLNGASFGENDTADFDDFGQLPLKDRPPSPDCFKLLSELP